MGTSREHDLVLFGATGFVGRLTAACLASAAPAGTRIALGGRPDLAATAEQGLSIPGVHVEVTDVNGAPGVVAWVRGAPYMTMSLVVADGLVEQVLVVRNPDKLRGLRTADLGSAG